MKMTMQMKMIVTVQMDSCKYKEVIERSQP